MFAEISNIIFDNYPQFPSRLKDASSLFSVDPLKKKHEKPETTNTPKAVNASARAKSPEYLAFIECEQAKAEARKAVNS